jgi:hypothetical protein
LGSQLLSVDLVNPITNHITVKLIAPGSTSINGTDSKELEQLTVNTVQRSVREILRRTQAAQGDAEAALSVVTVVELSAETGSYIQ